VRVVPRAGRDATDGVTEAGDEVHPLQQVRDVEGDDQAVVGGGMGGHGILAVLVLMRG